jgi:adenylosuccinate lyase
MPDPHAGIDITDEQISQMEANVLNIDFAKAEKKETETRHDVMAHVYTYGDCCPAAQGIIHMGATSCFVGDNTDIVQLKEGMELLRRKLVKLLAQMKTFAGAWGVGTNAIDACMWVSCLFVWIDRWID